ncbi:MAG: serine hydrolase [Acidobacteria bacterium]|nr:serine hydrolase [Acidobacteriota bacterium]
MKKLFLLAFVLLLPGFVIAQDINKILEERLKQEPVGSAVSATVVDESGVKFYNTGTVSKKPNANAADKDTVYEIGSITKVFTGILLAEAIKRGEVKLDDPLSKYLPESVKAPEFGGKEITLLDLTTHGSSLPSLTDDFKPNDPLNPYANFTIEQLYAFLGRVKLEREIGSKFEYSNIGVGLLGHILAEQAKMSYEDLVKARILKPLKMNDSAVTFTPSMKSHLAYGHNAEGKQTSNWDLPAIAGAGALRSTAADMAKFLSANMGLTKTKISDSLAEARKIRKTYDTPPFKIGFNWITSVSGGKDIIWHNGGTGGYRAFAGIDQDAKKGVFVVTNGSASADDIGFHILNPSVPLRKIEKPRATVSLSEEVLEKYVGEYELAPNVLATMTREKDRLFGQLTGQPRFELFAEKEDHFFLKAVKADVKFTRDESGNVTGFVLLQDGNTTNAKKIK